MTAEDSCAVAHGAAPSATTTRTLVTVFASPVADYLLRYGADLGYRTILVEPERGRISNAEQDSATAVRTDMPPDLDDNSHGLVPENVALHHGRDVAIVEMQIGSADRGGSYFENRVARI